MVETSHLGVNSVGSDVNEERAFGGLKLEEEKKNPKRPKCTVTFKIREGEVDHFENIP